MIPMELPKVSIISVVLNAAKTVRDCIESVMGQTYRTVEHIFIDGGSTELSAFLMATIYMQAAMSSVKL
jgi:glycosyltransferase involved in cell wall biosynthesis